jgi:hypothetical protein
MKVKAPVNAQELMARMDELLGRGTAPAAPSETPAGIGRQRWRGCQTPEPPPKKPRKSAEHAYARKKL